MKGIEQVTEKIRQLCRMYQDCCVEMERREEGWKLRGDLERLCQDIRGKLDITKMVLLLALLDAYEITRDEEMLQEVLDVVSGHLEQLEVSGDGVKLLAYCYYYVEEEECLVKARGMLEELRRRGEDVREAEKVLQNW